MNTFKIVDIVDDTMYNVDVAEQEILKSNIYYKPKKRFGGYTECLQNFVDIQRYIPNKAGSLEQELQTDMTFIVTESCIKCKYTDCVDVCPQLVDCFHEGPNFLVIDPDECIDCGVCIPECPVDAIYADSNVPDNQKSFTPLNAELSKIWPVIFKKKPQHHDADIFKDIKDKRDLLEK